MFRIRLASSPYRCPPVGEAISLKNREERRGRCVCIDDMNVRFYIFRLIQRGVINSHSKTSPQIDLINSRSSSFVSSATRKKRRKSRKERVKE